MNNTQPGNSIRTDFAARYLNNPITGAYALAGKIASSCSLPRRMAGLVLIMVFLAGVPALTGQTTTPPETTGEDPLPRRFSIGARGGILFPNLMNTDSQSSSTSEPPMQMTIGSTSTASHLGGGVAVEFAVFDRLGIGFDVLYRRSGYKTGTDIIEGVDDEDTDEDDRLYTTSVEGTRANYWDIPIVARFYDTSRRETRPGVFLELGAALRYAVNIRTFREHLYTDNTTEVDETPVTPANRMVPGIVLGGGFNLKGGGLRIMPSARFTHWMANTFDSPPTMSKTNQWEILLGIMF